MIPGDYNITIMRGSTFEITVTAKDTISAMNFSSTYTGAELKIYHAWLDDDDPKPNDVLFELSTANGLMALMGEEIRLYIPATMTAGLAFSSGVYTLKLLRSGADPIVDPILKGMVKVEGH